ncbi:DUF1330 domain-containing protein [Hyphomonas johnsonii]|uniref:DUF1330 domain-containing protein n=1 Tax=Hyphomonas johnsonii MHS-2 TaxID=1280950 RepID=A0A059FUP3_9PROT|nr:DUF1330 domain-containing protein [Hyphomonas johnsonii]KCZ94410.1 hypothetical protein HJO_03510 [Hyphomonas johnsonii MHS-2]
MAAYIIAQINIADRETYSKYEARFMDAFTRFGGRLLSVDENVHVLEGDWSYTRTVLAEFPSKPAALEWYDCHEYQALAAFRHAASVSNVVLLDAFAANPG